MVAPFPARFAAEPKNMLPAPPAPFVANLMLPPNHASFTTPIPPAVLRLAAVVLVALVVSVTDATPVAESVVNAPVFGVVPMGPGVVSAVAMSAEAIAR